MAGPPTSVYTLSTLDDADLSVDLDTSIKGDYKTVHRLLRPFVLLMPIVQLTSLYGKQVPKGIGKGKGFDRVKFTPKDNTCKAGIKASILHVERDGLRGAEALRVILAKLSSKMAEVAKTLKLTNPEIVDFLNTTSGVAQAAYVDPKVRLLPMGNNKYIDHTFMAYVEMDDNNKWAVKAMSQKDFALVSGGLSYNNALPGQVKIYVDSLSYMEKDGKMQVRLEGTLSSFLVKLFNTEFMKIHFPPRMPVISLEQELEELDTAGLEMHSATTEEGAAGSSGGTYNVGKILIKAAMAAGNSKSSHKRRAPIDGPSPPKRRSGAVPATPRRRAVTDEQQQKLDRIHEVHMKALAQEKASKPDEIVDEYNEDEFDSGSDDSDQNQTPAAAAFKGVNKYSFDIQNFEGYP